MKTQAWDFAERFFRTWVEKNPGSELVPEAIMRQGEALIGQRRYAAGLALLTAHQGEANKLADQYLFWRAEAQYGSTNYPAAAELYGKLTADFKSSGRLLEAAIGEAAARAKLGDWPKVAELLKKPDGAFRQTTQNGKDGKLAASGFLLLAEAELQQRNYTEAEKVLQAINDDQLTAEARWLKQFRLCRSRLGAGRSADALDCSTNLLMSAEAARRQDLIAESVTFRASVFEQLGQTNEAIAALSRNLTNAPPDRQRQAIAKIAELALAQNRPEAAVQMLEQFLTQFTNAPATGDVLPTAWLALGELHLRHHLFSLSGSQTNTPSPGGSQPTNELAQALASFDRLVAGFPNSALVGKAQLYRGWCFWNAGKMAESAEAFKTAAERLSPSEDQAVARFKLADALYARNDFTNALQNYRQALAGAEKWPHLKEILASQCLYQVLRASLEIKDMAGATTAMQSILSTYPRNPEADRSFFLTAQGFADLGSPDEARAQFQKFVEQYPDSALRPEAELALARTAELKADWAGAIAQYDTWIKRFPTNVLRPQAEFYQAMASFRAGDETNAVAALTNFVVQYRTNELAPQAQWAVAGYHFDQGAFQSAEIDYKDLFNHWPNASLIYEARMMAGRAALRRGGREAMKDAITHFTNLTSNPNCPPKLMDQALFAYGGTLVSLEPGGTNRLANYQQAKSVFEEIRARNPDNETAALAWGEIANCWKLMASENEAYFIEATNAYQKVIDSPRASVAVRSQARVGLGQAEENLAARRTGDEKKQLLKQALECYQQVTYANELGGENADLFWVKEAGLKATRLLTDYFGDWAQAKLLCEHLARTWSELRPTFDKKLTALQEQQVERK